MSTKPDARPGLQCEPGCVVSVRVYPRVRATGFTATAHCFKLSGDQQEIRAWEILGLSDDQWNSIEDVMAFDDPVPLLPPATSLTAGPQAWADALEALAQLPQSCIDEKGTSTLLEVGRIVVYANLPTLRCHYISGSQIGRDLTYDARGRDHQKEGVLRQWLRTVEATAGEGV